MEMDQISLQTLDRARVSIYDAPSSISPGLLIPLLLRAKAHTRAHKGPRFHGPFVVYTGRATPVSAPIPLTPSFHSVHNGRAPFASSSRKNSPVTRIHQVSTKYRKAIFSTSLSFLLSFFLSFFLSFSSACTYVKSRGPFYRHRGLILGTWMKSRLPK